MSKQSFFKGTMVLILAGLIVKVLGFINRIMLARLIGAEGLGLYQMAVPTFILIVSLATFGLNVSISKMVAEADARGDREKIRSILQIALLIVTVLSLFFTTVMVLGSRIIASTFLTDSRAFYSLIAISPIVPIVAISSVFRGYFQGKQNMTPTATSQIIEQIIRMFTVIFFAMWLLPKGIEYASAGAMGGVVVGELGGMLSLLWQFRQQKMPRLLKKQKLMDVYQKNKETFQGLLQISLPVTMSRIVGSLTFFIEPIVVAQSLAIAGIAASAATKFYGQLSGMAIPLLAFPTFFTYSLSVSLVPAVAEAEASKNFNLVHRRIYQSLRIALVIGAPCTALLFVFAHPLAQLVYHDDQVGRFLRMMAPYSILLYFQGPLQAALQGLGYASVAMRNTIIGALLKTGAIIFLASRPEIGFDGAVLSVNISIVSVTLLHFFSITKLTGFTLKMADFLKVAFSVALSSYSAFHLTQYWTNTMAFSKAMLLAAVISILIYLLLLIWLKILGKQDVQRIPWIGESLANFFPRR